MFCPKCGKFVEDGQSFCGICGCEVEKGLTEDSDDFNSHSRSYQLMVAPSKKWFNFVIYIQLFLSAAGNALIGILDIFGVGYENDGNGFYKLNYDYFPNGMRTYHIVFGIICIVIAAYCLFTRWQLAGYKKKGPLFYLVSIGVMTVVNFTGSVIKMMIIDDYSWVTSYLLGLVLGIVVIALNNKYFKRRSYLFVN